MLFVREWLREAYAVRTSAKVNDLGALAGDDLVLVNGRGLWIGDEFPAAGRDACAMAGAEIVYVTLTKQTAAKIQAADFAGFLAAAAKAVPAAKTGLKLLGYPWHLIEENGARDPRRFQEARPERRPRHARPQRRHLGAAKPGLHRPDGGRRTLRRH